MSNTESELIEAVKSAENIIVYGVLDRGILVTKSLMANGFHSKIHVAVTDIKLNQYQGRLLDFEIKSIKSLSHIAKNSIVIIATRTKFHDEIEETLNSLGFAKKIRVSDDLFRDINSRHTRNDYRIEKINQKILQYRTMNLIKLNHLRNKVKDGKKINVVFILSSYAKFNFASVYRCMENKELFEVSIYITAEHQIDLSYDCYDFSMELKKKGFNAVWGYDEESNPIPIDLLSPDIIFYNAPFNYNPQVFSQVYQFADKLMCYIPYGLHISNDFEYHFQNGAILPAWKHFIDSRQAYNLCCKYTKFRATNAVLSGHPMFDDYEKKLETKAFEKILNGKKIVIYAPHWSLYTWHTDNIYRNNTSFHVYYKYFMELLKKHPEINFVFKPHPKLRLNIIRDKDKDIGMGNNCLPIALQEFDEYCKAWNDAPNGLVVTDSSFIDLFRISDCLITDSYSFLVSWLPTDKPCILPMTESTPPDYLKYYYDFMHPLVKSYYTTRNESELDAAFEETVIEGKDVKADERKALKKQLLHNFGKAGQFIADYIEQQLLN